MVDMVEGFTYNEPWPDQNEGFQLTALSGASPTDLEIVEAAYRRT